MPPGLQFPQKPNPQYWRDRAKKTRADAERSSDPIAKRLLLAIADSYERLAERIGVGLRLRKRAKGGLLSKKREF
jgi:hypothetical protein